VINKHLSDKDYFVGNRFTIADIAYFSWVNIHEFAELELNDYPNVKKWLERVSQRESIKKAYKAEKPAKDKVEGYDFSKK